MRADESQPLTGEPRAEAPRSTAWKKAAVAGLSVACVALIATLATLSSSSGGSHAQASGIQLSSMATQISSDKYRIVVEGTGGANGGIVQFSQLEMFDLDGNKVDFTATTDAELCTPEQGPDKLTDGSSNTKFCTNTHGPVTVQMHLDEDVVLASYRFMSADDNPQRDPTNFKLGEFKEGIWETESQIFNYIHNRGSAMPRHTWSRTFGVTVDNPDKVYKFRVTKTGGNADQVQIGEIELVDVAGSVVPFTATVAEPLCNPHQGPTNLGDGNAGTKLCVKSPTVEVILSFRSPQAIMEYRWRAANDNQARDPTNFELIEFDVPPVHGSHHTVSSKIDYIHKRGSPLEREEWTPYFDVIVGN